VRVTLKVSDHVMRRLWSCHLELQQELLV